MRFSSLISHITFIAMLSHTVLLELFNTCTNIEFI